MITNKDDEQKGQGLALDVDAFEMQVDREIDSLFVPGDVLTAPEEKPSAVHVVHDVEIQVVEAPGPVAVDESKRVGGRSEAPPAGINVEAFEMQIDKEIDSLFVPADADFEPAEETSPIITKPEIQSAGVVPDRANGGRTASEMHRPVPKLELEGDSESEVIETPREEMVIQMEKSSPPMDTGEIPSPSSPPSDLPGLVENFNIAYLSLDWEFSVENVTKLWGAVENLRLYCEKSRETLFLFKLLRSLLHRVRLNPDAVQPEVVEMMKNAQEVLKTLLLSETGPGSNEKEKLRNLVSRYKAMRDRFGERREAEAEAVRVERASPFDALRSGPRPDWPSMDLERWEQWKQTFVQVNREALRIFENVAKAVREIEGNLPRTVALRKVSQQLADVGFVLEQYASFSKARNEEWQDGLEWLRQNHLRTLEEKVAVSAPTPVFREAVHEEIPIMQRAEPAEDTLEDPVVTRNDQAFIFSLCGKQFAILAKHVLKIDRVNTKKVANIIARGYAVLSDFKPFYRSIRSGLLGAWSGLPSVVLKNYRFLPIPEEIFGMPGNSTSAGGVILVSTGRHHGIIFVDSPVVDLHNDTEIKMKRHVSGHVLGTALGDSGDPVEVLNMDALVRGPRQEGDENTHIE